ncbi:MAG: PKD domain-containing protein [Saprospiraceae bacterium]|nr:PKD domain-containing protein [Saprospiraceae bacterium]
MKRMLTIVGLVSLCMFFGNNSQAQGGQNYKGVRNQNGILLFESQQRLEEILTALRIESDNYFTENPRTEISCETDDPVLEAFEATFGFYSLRKSELELECELLNQGSTPDALPLPKVLDNFLAATLNAKGQIRIGQDIYYLYSENITYTIVGGSLNTLAQLEAGANPYQFPDVQVEMVGGGGCSAEFSVNISPTSNTVNFSFQGQPSTGSVVYYWEFGDGETSLLQNPTHTYNSSGQYDVCLNIEVNGEEMCVDYVCKTISVGDSDCFAFFIYNQTGAPGQICFQDLSTFLDDVASWQWGFGDGTPNSYEQNPCHTFTCDKTYYVNLKITTISGCTSSFLLPVFVSSNNCCGKKGKHDGIVEYNNGQNRIKYLQEQVNLPFWRKVGVLLINYKLNSNGKWKRDKANLKINLDGDVFLSGAAGCKCQTPYPLDYTETAISKKSMVVLRNIGNPYRSKVGFEWTAKYYIDNQLLHTQMTTVICD